MDLSSYINWEGDASREAAEHPLVILINMDAKPSVWIRNFDLTIHHLHKIKPVCPELFKTPL
jgi:hypothetical protein